MDTINLIKIIWILSAACSVDAQDRIPVTMVTTHPFIDSNRPEYRCYVSSSDTGVTVTSRRVVDIWTIDRNNAEPSRPVRVIGQPYPTNSTVYRSTAPGVINNHDAGVGVFSCDVSRQGTTDTTVSNVILRSRTFSRPSDGLVTQTVNVGDTGVRLEMDLTTAGGGSGIASWRRNAGQPFSTDSTYFDLLVGNRRIEFIPEIIEDEHEGVYVPQHANIPGAGNSPDRGIKILIVRSCPADHWAPPGCFGVCDYCYNGGVCDDDTGRCICAPGFMGPNCLTACGGNRFGPDCEFRCKYSNGNEASCTGMQFCLLDPYGCRCNTGWKDLSCRDACAQGTFGASCLQSCNCDGTCDRFIGECNGVCQEGWSGNSCQIPDDCPTGYYGSNCTQKCYCKDDADCDKITGECQNLECAPVYMVYPGSVKCQECRRAFHGEACLQPCRCPEEYCDKVSGRCRGPCLSQWVDSFSCLAGLQTAVSPRFNPGTMAEVACVSEIHSTSSGDLKVHLSREPFQVDSSGIESTDRMTDQNTERFSFRVSNVTDRDTLYCLMTDGGGEVVAGLATTIYEYELPALGASPSLVEATTTSLSVQWRMWNEADDTGDPPIVAYIPYYRQTGTDQWVSGDTIAADGPRSFTVSDLKTDTLYEFSVTVVREGERGEGPMGPIMQLRTICDVSGISPVNVSATVDDAAPNIVNVSWQRPVDIVCTTGISFFFIYSVENGKDPRFEAQADGDVSWALVEGIKEGEYSFVVTLVIDEESDYSQGSRSVYVKGAGLSIGVIIAVVIIATIVIIMSVFVVFFYRRRKNKEEEEGIVGYKQNDIRFGGLNNHYTADDEEHVKKLGDDTESEEEIDENEEEEEDVSPQEESAGIKVSDLREYINTNLKNGQLEQEFSRLLPNKQYPWNVAEKKENKTKNRFRNMYTYDHSRVVLNKQLDDPHSDYYNASHIVTEDDRKPFIAAQGPNKASLNDFWRMVWSQNISTIVMVTNLEEKGRERCLQYWPTAVGSSRTFGDVEVYWKEKTEFADYVVRKLECGTSFQTRTVHQLHFTTWPDMGTPKQPTPLIAFTKHAKMIHKDVTAPMLVHCSAGIGRTGTFIALYSLLDVVLQEKFVDVFSFAQRIRESRINMIQTGKQYVYLYECLLEASLTTGTEISRGQVRQLAADDSMGSIRKEYEILRELEGDTIVHAEYLKRQGGDKRPFSMSEQLYNLRFYVEGNLLKSFKKADAFVTLKHPDSAGIDGLWKLVHSWQCPLMVTLDNVDDKPYWPEKGSVNYAETSVHFRSVASKGPLTIRKFDVTRNDKQGVVALKHIELTARSARDNVEALADLVVQVNKLKANSALEGPIIVLCGNGEALSGVFCAVMSEVERLETTGTMDVFKTVRQLKETNGNIVPTEMEYLLCYKVLFCYIQGNKSYENF